MADFVNNFEMSVSKNGIEPGATHFITNICESAAKDCQNDIQHYDEFSTQLNKTVSAVSQNVNGAKPEIIYVTQKTQTNMSSYLAPDNSDSKLTSDFQTAEYIQACQIMHSEKPTFAPMPQCDVLEEMKRQIAQRFIKTYKVVTPKEDSEDEKACYVPGTDCEYRTPGASFRNKQGRVKRPMNAFMVWARDYRARLAETMPNATNAEVSIKLGQLWANLQEDEKAKFYQKATEIKLKHREDFPDWVFRPSPSTKTKEVTSPRNSGCGIQHLSTHTTGPPCPASEMGPQMPHHVLPTPPAVTPVSSSTQMSRFPVVLQRVQCVPYGKGVPHTVPQGVPQSVHQTVPQCVPQGNPQCVHQTVQRGVPQGVQQGVHQTVQRGVPQGVQQGVHQTVQRGVPQGVQQGVHQTVQRGVPQGVPQSVHQTVQRGVPQGNPQGVPQTVQRGVPQGVSQGVHQSVQQGIPQIVRPIIQRGVHQSVLQGVPQGMRQTVPQGVHQTILQGMHQAFPQGVPQIMHQTISQGVPQTIIQGARQTVPVPQKPHILALTKEMLVNRLSRDRSGACTTDAAIIQSPMNLWHSTPIVKTELVPSIRSVQSASCPGNRGQSLPYPGRQLHTVRYPTAPEIVHPESPSVKVWHTQNSSTGAPCGSACIQGNGDVDAARRQSYNSSQTDAKCVETIDVTQTLGMAYSRENGVESSSAECSPVSANTPGCTQEDSRCRRRRSTGSESTVTPTSRLDTSWPFPFPEEPSDSWSNDGGPAPMYRQLLETHDPFKGCDWLYSEMYPGGLELDVDRWLRYLNDDESPTKNESLSCFENDNSSDDIQVSPLPLKDTLARLLNAQIEKSEDGDVIVGNFLLPEDDADTLIENVLPVFADVISKTDEPVKAPISSSENANTKSLMDVHSIATADAGESEDIANAGARISHKISPAVDTLESFSLMNTRHLVDHAAGESLLRGDHCSSIVTYIGGGDGGTDGGKEHVESNAAGCLIDSKGGDCHESNKHITIDTFEHHEGMPDVRWTRSIGKVPHIGTENDRRTKESTETTRATPCRRHRSGTVSRRIK